MKTHSSKDIRAILNKSFLFFFFLITKCRQTHMPDLEYIWAGVVSLSVQEQLGKEINGLSLVPDTT